MIGKITKGKSFSGCIKYILDEAKDAKLLNAQGVRLKSKESIIQSFVMQAKLRPTLGKSVGHIALNFSVEDKSKLTDEFMVKMAREYLQKMGIQNTQYIVARHFDKEHPHLHICFNRVDNMGKTISDKNDQHRNVKVSRELTEKYNLHIAEGKEKVKQHRLKEPDRTKYEIFNSIKDVLPKCKNWEELTGTLLKQGVATKFKYKGQTNEIQGVIFSKGEYSLNGSKVDRQFSYSKIDHQLNQNSQAQNETVAQSALLDSSLEAFAGLSTMEQHGDDFDELAFTNRMEYEEQQRQRKKKRGMRF